MRRKNYETEKLSAPALQALQQSEASGFIYISAITLIEITYLVEKGRIAPLAQDRLDDALQKTQTALRVCPLDWRVSRALRGISRDAIPDMPDRIIAATALHPDLPLITRDAKICASPIPTIW